MDVVNNARLLAVARLDSSRPDPSMLIDTEGKEVLSGVIEVCICAGCVCHSSVGCQVVARDDELRIAES